MMHYKKTCLPALSVILTFSLLACSTSSELSESELFDYAAEQQLPLSDFNIYRGNTHGHTLFTWSHGWHRESDSTFSPTWNVPAGMNAADPSTISMNPDDYTNQQGLPANHFQHAKAAGYDFYVTTDHSQEMTLQPVSPDNAAWRLTQEHAAAYNDDPDFVALVGIEFSRNTPDGGGNGHINPINIAEYVNADHRSGAPPWPEANWSIPQFYDWLKTAQPAGEGYVTATFNHPGLNQYNDWDHLDDEIVDIITMFELHTNYGRPRWRSYLRALNKGWKVSPVGAHDNHGFGPIDNPNQPPPTLVLAPELTKTAITRAMRQRRTFASWHPAVELLYSVNGHIMGSELESPDDFDFQIEILTREGYSDEKVRRIQILRDHPDGIEDVEIVAEREFDGSNNWITWSTRLEDATAKYFLLRIHHGSDITEGEFNPHGSTYSAPVWTGR